MTAEPVCCALDEEATEKKPNIPTHQDNVETEFHYGESKKSKEEIYH